MSAQTVNLTILDKEYRVASPPEAEEGLKTAARLLNERMKQIKASGRVLGTERIAVMAALNLIYELMNEGQSAALHDEAIQTMISKIDAVLPQVNAQD
ncbi:MAG: cell division protein ZapA [Gammaproteobacteria bacterium]|nr:MAG: cell division protein ZapA [Gammaproteobacteria bacterium]